MRSREYRIASSVSSVGRWIESLASASSPAAAPTTVVVVVSVRRRHIMSHMLLWEDPGTSSGTSLLVPPLRPQRVSSQRQGFRRPRRVGRCVGVGNAVCGSVSES